MPLVLSLSPKKDDKYFQQYDFAKIEIPEYSGKGDSYHTVLTYLTPVYSGMDDLHDIVIHIIIYDMKLTVQLWPHCKLVC